MFGTTLGNFSFQDIGVLNILLIIFIFLSNIILLNLLIAIFSNTYETIMEKSNL